MASPRLDAEVFREEAYDLVAGWNLIHVPIEPVVKEPAAALSAIGWESLWTWLPSDTEPRGGRWLSVYRDAPAFLNELAQPAGTSALFSFTGPASYLLLATAPGTLRVNGAVRANRQTLRGGVFQLFGPSIDRSSPPALADYFSRPEVRENLDGVFELAGQSYRSVAGAAALRAGAAYWVLPDQFITAPDPLRVSAGLNGLRFDAQTTLQEVVVDVGTLAGAGAGGQAGPRQFTLRAVPSLGSTASPSWLEIQKADGAFVPLSAAVTVEAPGDQSILRLTFRARQQTLGPAVSGVPAAVVDLTSPAGKVTVGAELEVPTLTGTWLGEATLSEVERPSFHGGGYAPSPAVSMSVILEMPQAGPSRLLPCISVQSSRDGRNVSYRLEAALFPAAVTLSGAVASDGKGGTLTGTIDMSAGDPLNPYRHRYHPEHGAGIDHTRSAALRFGATLPGQDPAPGDVNPLASVGILSGVYEEEITGLSQEPVRVRGTFRLRRLASGAAGPCATTQQ